LEVYVKHFIYLFLFLFSGQFLFAQDEEEVIVTASLTDQKLSDIGKPVNVISGDELDTAGRVSLGEVIDDLLGVSSADYGFAVGQPVLRGMSGPRVKTLRNGIVQRDVSGLGADHPIEINLNDIQQIEIVRGPSSLLFTNGGIGGIINVVDNTIARQDFDSRNINIDFEGQSMNNGSSLAFGASDNINGVNLSYSYENTDFGNFDIPDEAVKHSDEEHHDEHEGEEEEHHDEHEEKELSYLENSDFERFSHRLGFSKVEDWGYIGASVNVLQTHYGIPYHGEGHGGHDEHGDEEEHEGEEEHHEEEGHDEHEGERIFSVTDSRDANIQGSYAFDSGNLGKIDYFLRNSNYKLTEDHAEAGHDDHEGEEEHDEHEDEDEHGHEEGPTVFSNDSIEAGAIFDFSSSDLEQKISINLSKEDTSVIGQEAFMSPAQSDEYTLGYFISKEFQNQHLDFGVRYDSINRRGSFSEHDDHDDHDGEEDHDEHEGEEDHDEDEEEHAEKTLYDIGLDSASLALTYCYDFLENVKIFFGASSVQRAPAAVELFMNGPHLATGRLETGNPNLNAERSNNLDVTLEFDVDGWYGKASVYSNSVTDYIYLQDETEEDHEEHAGEDDHGGLIAANYLQKDAEFNGYEFEVGKVFDVNNGEVEISFGRDTVEGKFTSGGFIPRMSPSRNLFKISYENDAIKTTLSFKDVEQMDNLALNETMSEAYQMVNFTISAITPLGPDVDLKTSFFASNILDEVARNHNSFVKDQVPLPGRNFGLRFSLRF
tara:strand:+ start:704 stop:3010 length:2307 start_codon:yes stop_codon:yes gene_type:complete